MIQHPHHSDPAPVSLIGEYAGFISRVIAFFVDTTIISISIIVVSWFASTTFELFNVKQLLESLGTYIPVIQRFLDPSFVPVIYSIVTITFILLYHVLFIFITGQTPGKGLLGLRTVSLNGDKMKLWRATVRYLGYYLSALPLGLGFLWIIIDDRRLAWHDKLAGTCVIYTWEAQPDEKFLYRAIKVLSASRKKLRKLRNQGDQIAQSITEQQNAHSKTPPRQDSAKDSLSNND